MLHLTGLNSEVRGLLDVRSISVLTRKFDEIMDVSSDRHNPLYSFTLEVQHIAKNKVEDHISDAVQPTIQHGGTKAVPARFAGARCGIVRPLNILLPSNDQD
jgi:hypothetical protein